MGRADTFVALVATGGTIATVQTAAGTAPAVDADTLTAIVSDLGSSIRSEQFAQTPSWRLGAEEMWRLALRARDIAREPACRGVVVTHGTSTLEYGAYFADLALDVETPVVFTGAMRHADDPAPDGPENLRASVRVALDERARGRGVLVCFAGDILAARDVWKAERAAAHAFVGLRGRVGAVDARGVSFIRPRSRRTVFEGPVEPRVTLVKAYPGADGSGVEATVSAGARGLVVEGLPGSGGVPPAMRTALERAARSSALVVLASRAPYGRLPDTGGGTGSPLASLPLASAGDLTAEKAWVLASVILGTGATGADARRRFEAISLQEDEA